VNLPDSGECELKVIREPSETGGQDLALKSGGFDSADAAGAAGEKTLAGLLLTSLRQGYGVSTLARTPPGVVTKYGKAMMAGDRFDSIYDDRYGLTVFEDVGRPGFVSVGEVRPLVSGYGTQFCEIWSAAIPDAVALDERTSSSYDLYASSRFENSSRTQFLLLVMAIEALAEQPKRSKAELDLIEALLVAITRSELSQEQRGALLSGVGMLKRVSIRHACRMYLTRSAEAGIVTDTEAVERFTRCYEIRGRIVHGGATPSPAQLTSESNAMQTTIRELLTASIEGRAILRQKTK
jgi:hypothetical protein